MKKTILSVALVLALSTSAFAGNRDGRNLRCEFPCEQMVKDLNLSDKQVAELKEADKAFDEEMNAIREKRRDMQKTWREEVEAARDRRDSTLKSVLTKDQYIQYLEQRLECRDNRRPIHMRGHRNMPPRDFKRKGVLPGCCHFGPACAPACEPVCPSAPASEAQAPATPAEK